MTSKNEQNQHTDDKKNYFIENINDHDSVMVGLASGALTIDDVARLKNAKEIEEAQAVLDQLEREKEQQSTFEFIGVVVIILLVVIGAGKILHRSSGA